MHGENRWFADSLLGAVTPIAPRREPANRRLTSAVSLANFQFEINNTPRMQQEVPGMYLLENYATGVGIGPKGLLNL